MVDVKEFMVVPERVRTKFLLGLAFTLAAVAQAAAQSSPFSQVLTDEIGLNLLEMPWWYIQEVAPGLEGENRKSRVVLPMARPLEIAEEGATWLVCNISVAPYDTPASVFYGTEVMIGNIGGNDQTYWNKTLIGETTGRHLSEAGRFRRYKVPREALRLGDINQLRIRLKPFGGSRTVTAPEGRITIAPLSAAPADWQLRAYQDQMGQITREVYRLGRYRPDFLPYLEFLAQRQDVWVALDVARGLIEQGAYRLLRESFEEIESELEILRQLAQPVKRQVVAIEQRKYQMDMVRIAGLEGVRVKNYGELKDRGWDWPRPKPDSFARWGWFFRDGLPALREVTPSFIEGPEGRRIALLFSRVLDVQVVDLNWVSKTYLVRAELELEGRKEVADFEIVTSVFYPGVLIFPKFKPYGEVLRATTIQKFFDMRTKYLTQMPARPPGERGSVLLGWDGGEQDVPTLLRFTPSHFDPLGLHIAACFPAGLRRLDTRSWSVPEETPKDLRSFPVIEYLSRNFPWQCREYYRYDKDSDRILIYNVFEYYYRPKDNQFLVIAPPVLSFAKANGYPVEVQPKLLNLGIDTHYGPLQGGYARAGILKYSLPVPSLEDRVLPGVKASEPMQTLLNESVGEWEKAEATNGVDALYKGITAAYNAWFQLPPRQREALAQEAVASMDTGLQADCWPESVEPFSGLPVSWTYDLEGPYHDGYDQEWGNGLSLYGLYKYCQFSGDWRMLANHWEQVQDIWGWFTRTDDWAWMRCANARHGHGTGAGDCSLAAFSGAWAYTKMTHRMGRQANAEEGRYILARMAVPLVARLAYTPWAREQKAIEPEEVVLGFHEGEGFLRGRLDAYPWDVTSLISGNGIHPEAMEFLLEYARPQLEQYVESFDQYYPDWANGQHAYPSSTLYQGNSGYITMPQLYLRSRLGGSAERLDEALEQAKTNRALWWVAPPVLAERLTGHSGVVVTDWELMTLRDVHLLGSQVDLMLANRVERPQTVTLRLEWTPKACWLNREPHSAWDYDESSKRLVIRELPRGMLHLRVAWDPAAAPEQEGS